MIRHEVRGFTEKTRNDDRNVRASQPSSPVPRHATRRICALPAASQTGMHHRASRWVAPWFFFPDLDADLPAAHDRGDRPARPCWTSGVTLPPAAPGPSTSALATHTAPAARLRVVAPRPRYRFERSCCVAQGGVELPPKRGTATPCVAAAARAAADGCAGGACFCPGCRFRAAMPVEPPTASSPRRPCRCEAGDQERVSRNTLRQARHLLEQTPTSAYQSLPREPGGSYANSTPRLYTRRQHHDRTDQPVDRSHRCLWKPRPGVSGARPSWRSRRLSPPWRRGARQCRHVASASEVCHHESCRSAALGPCRGCEECGHSRIPQPCRNRPCLRRAGIAQVQSLPSESGGGGAGLVCRPEADLCRRLLPPGFTLPAESPIADTTIGGLRSLFRMSSETWSHRRRSKASRARVRITAVLHTWARMKPIIRCHMILRRRISSKLPGGTGVRSVSAADPVSLTVRCVRLFGGLPARSPPAAAAGCVFRQLDPAWRSLAAYLARAGGELVVYPSARGPNAAYLAATPIRSHGEPRLSPPTSRRDLPLQGLLQGLLQDTPNGQARFRPMTLAPTSSSALPLHAPVKGFHRIRHTNVASPPQANIARPQN